MKKIKTILAVILRSYTRSMSSADMSQLTVMRINSGL
jgi:hypothetical protein